MSQFVVFLGILVAVAGTVRAAGLVIAKYFHIISVEKALQWVQAKPVQTLCTPKMK
jgi:hypothetical protein